MSLCTHTDAISLTLPPVHAQSYALKDIQVQYKPPVSGGQSTFALPVGWRKPEMPPAAKFKVSCSPN